MNSFIKCLMEEKKIKQKDLAMILGISSPAVSQWNEEGTNINVSCLFTISKLFHVTVDELLVGKRSGESLEDKWARDYAINEEAGRRALIDGEKEKVINCFGTLSKTNKRFFSLFEKKIAGNITSNEQKEWRYLRQYYEIETIKSHLLNASRISRNSNDVDQQIISILIEKIGTQNIHSILWELQKIYTITHFGVKITRDRTIVPADDYYDDYGDDPLEELKDDEDVFFAVYESLSPIEKDLFLTTEFHTRSNKDFLIVLTKLFKNRTAEFLYKFIKRGGNILYLPSDLNLTNFDMSDLDDFEGEKKPVSELDKAQAAVYEIYDNYYLANYEQYQALINQNRMLQIEMNAKYKEKEPIKYWQYVKNIDVLI